MVSGCNFVVYTYIYSDKKKQQKLLARKNPLTTQKKKKKYLRKFQNSSFSSHYK
jgi:hypothetical protein